MDSPVRTLLAAVGLLLVGVLIGGAWNRAEAPAPRADRGPAADGALAARLDRIETALRDLARPLEGVTPEAVAPETDAPAPEPNARIAPTGAEPTREAVERLAAEGVDALAAGPQPYGSFLGKTNDRLLFTTCADVLDTFGRPDRVHRTQGGPDFMYRFAVPGKTNPGFMTLGLADGHVLAVRWTWPSR